QPRRTGGAAARECLFRFRPYPYRAGDIEIRRALSVHADTTATDGAAHEFAGRGLRSGYPFRRGTRRARQRAPAAQEPPHRVRVARLPETTRQAVGAARPRPPRLHRAARERLGLRDLALLA